MTNDHSDSSRREVLGWMAVGALSALAGCSQTSDGEPAERVGEAEQAVDEDMAFTAVYVYADGAAVTFDFPADAVSLYELHKTAGGAQTFYTTLRSTHRGTVTLTLDQGVYGFRVDPSVQVSVSQDDNVVVETRAKPSKDPWPTPPPPPPPTKFGSLVAATWNLHFKSPSLRANELMYSLGGTDALERPRVESTAASVVGIHVAATRRSATHPFASGDSELCFPLQTMAICHRMAHAHGARRSDLLVGEAATLASLRSAIARAAGELEAGGVLLLSFAGHGGRIRDESGDEPDGRDEVWQLFDGVLTDDELGGLLSLLHPDVHCVIVADCCNAAPTGAWCDDRRGERASTVFIGAVGEAAAKVVTPTSAFALALDEVLRLRPRSYRELSAALVRATAGSEQAVVWCSNEETWSRAPLMPRAVQ